MFNFFIRPRKFMKNIYLERPDLMLLGDGYSSNELNEYIVKKYLLSINLEKNNGFISLQAHSALLVMVIQHVYIQMNKALNIIDFGGGCPTTCTLLNALNLDRCVEKYTIIESKSFIKTIEDLSNFDCYQEEYSGGGDLLVLSSVLPYLEKQVFDNLLGAIKNDPPRFIYLGRTSFLCESQLENELYTIQKSKFKDHGAQIEAGFPKEIEEKFAQYPKRHLKLSLLKNFLTELSFRPIIRYQDESGLQLIEGLQLETFNSLWIRD